MKKTAATTIAILLLFSLAAASQDSSRQERKIPEFEKQVMVNRVLIDVIVVDDKGSYVRGLTAGDLDVYENGKKMEVKSVDEYFLEGEEPGSEELERMLYDTPPRNIIFVVDRLFSSTTALKRGREVLVEFIQKRLQPGDRAMILTFDRNFRILKDLTTDHKALEAAATGLNTLTASDDTPELTQNVSSDADSEFRLSSSDITNQSRYSQFVDPVKNIRMQNDIRMFLEKLQLLSKSFKSLPGRKTVILMSEGYDERLIHNPVTTTYRSPDWRLAESEVNREEISVTSDPSGRFQTSSLLSIYNEMVEGVNDSNTSFYVIDLSKLGGPTRTDMHYQQTSMQRVDYMSSRLDSLAALADTTGGKLYTGTENYTEILDRINNDISNYYIISYATPNTRQEGKYRKISVKAKNSAFSVRSREGYHEPKRFEKLNDRERFVHLVEPFFRSKVNSELDARSMVFFLPVFQNMAAGSLAIEIPADQLGSTGTLELELVGTITDNSDNRIDAFHQIVPYGECLEDIRERGVFTMKVPLVFKSGFNRLNVVARDNCTGKRYVIMDEYVANGTPPDDLYISSIALFNDLDHLSTLDRTSVKPKDIGDESGYSGHRIPDPLRAAVGKPIFPRMDLKFSTDEQPVVFFCAGNFWIDPKTNGVDFFINYTAVDENGEEIIVPVGKEKMYPIPGTNRINIISQLILSGLQEGEYKLRIRFLDRRKMQGVQRDIPIAIE